MGKRSADGLSSECDRAAVKVVNCPLFCGLEVAEYAGVTYLVVPLAEDRSVLVESDVVEVWFGDWLGVHTPGRRAKLFHEDGMSRYVQVEWLDADADIRGQATMVEGTCLEPDTAEVRFARLGEVSARLVELAEETEGLLRTRRELVAKLSADSFSHGRIAVAATVSRGRIFQILSKMREEEPSPLAAGDLPAP